MKEIGNLFPTPFHIHPSCKFYDEVKDGAIIDGVQFIKLTK